MMRFRTLAATVLGFVAPLSALLLFPHSTYAADGSMTSAFQALQQGHADDAERILRTVLTEQPSSADAHQLLCRVFYAEDKADQAIQECERAVALQPQNSDNQMWVGRAYGLKAQSSGPFTAFSLARKVHTAFERAVALSPSNIPADTALGDFLVEAPAVVGGGLDEAGDLARRMEPYSPAAAHRLRARVAEKQKDMATAEVEYRAAVAAGNSPEAWTDLGAFYKRQNQLDKSVAALHTAMEVDRSHGPALVDVATILTEAHRSPDLAEKALRLYLASPAKSEAAPAFKVHLQLGKLLAQHGDHAGARNEYEAAVALASSYDPARKALQGA